MKSIAFDILLICSSVPSMHLLQIGPPKNVYMDHVEKVLLHVRDYIFSRSHVIAYSEECKYT